MKAQAAVTAELQPGARRLGLGTVQFGLAYGVANQHGQVSRPEARKIVELAASAGIDTIDTAIGYGDSERYLGEIGMTDFKVITKLPALPAGTPDVGGWVNDQVSASAARLGVPTIYGLLLHRPMELLGANGPTLFKALCALKERTLVRKIGLSIYSPAELQALLAKFKVDIVQGPLNLIDRRLHTGGWLKRLKDRAIEVHTRSTFLQGLLLMPRDAIPAKFSRWSVLWDNWHQWLRRRDESALRACMAFPLSIPEIDRVLVGAESVDQVRQILASAGGRPVTSIPDLSSPDEELIDPAKWTTL